MTAAPEIRWSIVELLISLDEIDGLRLVTRQLTRNGQLLTEEEHQRAGSATLAEMQAAVSWRRRPIEMFNQEA